VTPEQEHHLLAVFDGAARRRFACLGDEFSAFFAATRLLPHFDTVEKARVKAVIDYHLSCAQKPNRNTDRSLDIWILSCWTHHGLWALRNEERRLLLGIWLERIVPGARARRSFKALSGADALRMRIVRLGLIGWGAFPQTYPEAPLRCDPLTRRLWVAAPWQAMWACVPSTKKVG
jgi:hypothetical protein